MASFVPLEPLSLGPRMVLKPCLLSLSSAGDYKRSYSTRRFCSHPKRDWILGERSSWGMSREEDGRGGGVWSWVWGGLRRLAFLLLLLGLCVLLWWEHERREQSWDEAPSYDEGETLRQMVYRLEHVPLPFAPHAPARYLTQAPPIGHLQHTGTRKRALRGGKERPPQGMRHELQDEDEDEEEDEGWGDRTGRTLQLLGEGAVGRSPLSNFSTSGLRIAPPYQGFSDCYYAPTCVNLTLEYGLFERCRLRRVCRICVPRHRGPSLDAPRPGGLTCQFFPITGSPGGVGAATSLSQNVPD